MTTRPETSTDSPRTVHGRGVESRTQTETETETTKTPSSRNDALARGRESEQSSTAAIREVHPLDAMTAAISTLRPDWRPERVRGVLARDRRPWPAVVEAALRCALDPEVRTPAAIENHDARQYGPSDAERHPSAVTYAERVAELRRITGEGA